MSGTNPHHQLLRVLGLSFGIAVVVGGVIGQGILRTPGIVARGVPYANLILLVWLVGAALTAIDAMTSAELGASIPRAGGPYAFAARAFGPLGGFLVGWLDWVQLCLATAFVSVVVAEYLQRLGLFAQVGTGMLAVVVVLLYGIINATGTRISGGVQNAVSVVKGLALIAFAAACFLLRGEAPVTTSPEGAGITITLAALVLAGRAVYGTFGGFNAPIYFSEEVRDSPKNVVRSIFVGIAAVTAIYILINAALIFVLPVSAIAASNLPLADALHAVAGPAAAAGVTLFALFSVATVGNLQVMMQSRALFAMARNRLLPAPLAYVATNGAPVVALSVTVLFIAALASSGVYEVLLTMYAPLATTINLTLNIAAITLRIREPLLARPYRMPLFPWPAILALTINGVLTVVFMVEDFHNARWSILFVGAALPIYFLMRRRSGNRTGDSRAR